MAYNPIDVTPPSWHIFCVNGLQKALRFSDAVGGEAPGIQYERFIITPKLQPREPQDEDVSSLAPWSAHAAQVCPWPLPSSVMHPCWLRSPTCRRRRGIPESPRAGTARAAGRRRARGQEGLRVGMGARWRGTHSRMPPNSGREGKGGRRALGCGTSLATPHGLLLHAPCPWAKAVRASREGGPL